MLELATSKEIFRDILLECLGFPLLVREIALPRVLSPELELLIGIRSMPQF